MQWRATGGLRHSSRPSLFVGDALSTKTEHVCLCVFGRLTRSLPPFPSQIPAFPKLGSNFCSKSYRATWEGRKK